MRNPKRIGLSLMLGVFSLVVTSNIARACTCDLPQNGRTLKQEVTEAHKKSKAVFVGRVVEVISDVRNSYVDVRFKVERSWKADFSAERIVRTGRGRGDCGYRFEVGKSYLVFAYGSDENRLETNICQRTRSAADAEDDLRLLGRSNPLVKSSSLRAPSPGKTQHGYRMLTCVN